MTLVLRGVEVTLRPLSVDDVEALGGRIGGVAGTLRLQRDS